MSEPKEESRKPGGEATTAGDLKSAGTSKAAKAGSSGRAPYVLRGEISPLTAVLCGLACLATSLLIWYLLTAGENEERILTSNRLPSPTETWKELSGLWFDGQLSRNLIVTLRRVTIGFALAVVVGVPLGVVCGCFPMANAFFAPVMIFGRNIPIAALIALMYSFFGIGEQQKIVFIFLATAAFIVGDTARAIRDIDARYLDTAYTLGATKRQTIFKVLVPLALPSVFNSIRLLFGLAFGYIMLAETITTSDTAGGIGAVILRAQRLGKTEYIILILLIIPLVALAIDRILYWIQRELFPHQFGGSGVLRKLWRAVAHGWEDVRSLVITPRSYADAIASIDAADRKKS